MADKSMSLFVRVTPGEHHRLTVAAKEEGISMAELTRRALLAVMVRPCRPHAWYSPTEGDKCLLCIHCSRALPFAELVEKPEVVMAIMRTHDDGEFREGFRLAMAKARRQRDPMDDPLYA